MTSILDSGLYFPAEEEDNPHGLDFLEDSARSVELVREEGREGQLGSFGFTLIQEKPPRVGTVIPGGPADRAGLKKGEIVLNVAGRDVTRLSHKEVTLMIRSNTETAIWLSVCENDDMPLNASTNGGLSSSYSSPPHKSYHSSTPMLASQHYEERKFNGLLHRPLNNSTLLSTSIPYSSSPSNKASPLIHKKVMPSLTPQQPNDQTYVMFIPSPSYVITRMWSALLYCGPVKLPDSWSQRGVSSLCIQECARQLLGKRKVEEFIKVHLEVTQSCMKITNTSGNILAKHRREDLYYCGLCSNDEQHFAIVTLDTETSSKAELCHVFKLLPDSRLSKYCIDKSKSLREQRAGQPTPLKSCIEITDTIQTIFQNDPVSTSPPNAPRRSLESSGLTDFVDYGTVRGISTFQMAPGSSELLGVPSASAHLSPSLKRKKSNLVDLRSKKTQQKISSNGKQRSTSIPLNAFEHRPLATTSSAGHVRYDEPVHVRMHSDGSTSSSSSSRSKPLPISLLRPDPPRDTKAKRISDSSLSSVSSDHSGSGHQSHSGSSSPKPHQNSGSPTPRDSAHSIKPILPPRKHSHTLQHGSKLALNGELGGSPSRGLRRQGSANSILDLPGLSPYHSHGLPSKNGHLSSSVDSIVTITTLAEDDLIDTVVGQVAGWCGSFDKLLEDPLGVQCLQQFLETQHGEENILFWKDVEQFKVCVESKVSQTAKHIFDEYLSSSAPHAINVDDRVVKNVEAVFKTTPTRHMYNEAQKEIYQLMKLDCYPRFKKSPTIRECMRAEMEGRPLPVSLLQSNNSKDSSSGGTVPWGKKKNSSLFSRFRNLQHKSVTAPSILSNPPPPSSLGNDHPLSQTVDISGKKNKKERRESKKLRTKSLEGSSSHPEENLKQLQVHKSNLFELSLPNRVTKIIEARPNTSIQEAITHVLKKYNYSLDIMEVKLTNTLQPVDVSAQATILIGKHVSVIRSKHTITVTFPDHPDVVLPARTPLTLRDLFDNMMVDKGKADSYSVFLEGARAPLELNMPAGNLEGHTVSIKYNSPNTFPSNTASTPPRKPSLNISTEANNSSTSSNDLANGVEELFSMIARLSSDTLLDQRTHDEQQQTHNKKLSPKDNKKHKRLSPKFGRTKSGTAISERLKIESSSSRPIPPPRSLSPPVVNTQSLPPQRYPPPPSSDPPFHYDSYNDYGTTGYARHTHQRSADAMSGVSIGSGSSVDSITHELAADRRVAVRNQLRDWVNNSSGGPQYFPTALGTSQDTLDRPVGNHSRQYSLPNSRGSSLSRQQAAILNPYRLGHASQQPLDLMVTDAFQRQQQQQQQQGGGGGGVGTWPNPSEQRGGAYPWRYVKGPGSTVSSDGQQFSDSESMASSGCHSNVSRKGPPLSPTTHVLVIEDQSGSETFV